MNIAAPVSQQLLYLFIRLKEHFVSCTFNKMECITFCCGVSFIFCTRVLTYTPVLLAREVFNGVWGDSEDAGLMADLNEQNRSSRFTSTAPHTNEL